MTENILPGEHSEHTLEYHVRQLAVARRTAETFKEALEAKRLAWMEEQKQLIEAVALSVKATADLEAELRAQALVLYEATKQKDLGWGVKVRVNQVLTYDGVQALEWAINHRLCLSLNRRQFEDFAKAAIQPLDFVHLSEEAVATIATDLEKVLKDGA